MLGGARYENRKFIHERRTIVVSGERSELKGDLGGVNEQGSEPHNILTTSGVVKTRCKRQRET